VKGKLAVEMMKPAGAGRYLRMGRRENLEEKVECYQVG